MKNLKFCSYCNYAVDKILIEHARYDYLCPNCESVKLSMFYSYGSMTHKMNALPENRRYKWHPRWMVPLPFPKTPKSEKPK